MYYTVIKHDGHLRTRGKCRKHEPQASVFYISECSQISPDYHSVIHGLGFYICFVILILRAQNNKTRFSMLYYYLLTESEVFTGKSRTETLPY